jgi:hypothetical protein
VVPGAMVAMAALAVAVVCKQVRLAGGCWLILQQHRQFHIRGSFTQAQRC